MKKREARSENRDLSCELRVASCESDFDLQPYNSGVMRTPARRYFVSFLVLFSLFFLSISTVFAQQWQGEYVYGPFEIYLNVDIKTVNETLKEIAALDGELTARLNLPPVREKIKLYIFPDMKSYWQYVQKEYPGAPQRRALFAMEKGKPGRIFTFLHGEFAVDLRHECTHALLHAKVGRLPIWFDEGLAEYFEVPASQRNTKEPYFSQIKRNVTYNVLFPVPDLKKLESIKNMALFEETHYRNSWSWLNFMLNDSDRQKIVSEYIAQCKSVNDAESEPETYPSFTEFLSRQRPKYKSEYKAYWKKLKNEN